VIDSHCHLADDKFAADLPAVVARATTAGVTTALCILSADEPDEVGRAADVRAAWPAVQFAAAIHPHRAAAYAGRAAVAAGITRAAAQTSAAVAIGEIGLDYHYDFAPRDVQRDVFAAQIALACERDLPVIIHTREAEDDTIAVLKEAGGPLRGVLHCFTGTPRLADEALALGLHVSFAGIVTFPKAANLREVARQIPADRILCETDSPYLAPLPHRGKRNEPAWVVRVAEELATARQEPLEALAGRMDANFSALFRP